MFYINILSNETNFSLIKKLKTITDSIIKFNYVFINGSLFNALLTYST